MKFLLRLPCDSQCTRLTCFLVNKYAGVGFPSR